MLTRARIYELELQTTALWTRWQVMLFLCFFKFVHPSNFSLLFHRKALHWVQQNIFKFGGDPNMVTLAGHGSGAACINFLMTSPTMVPGLFHRAILLSGSAFSSWALVDDPVVYALKLAKEVNCSIPDDLIKNHEQIVDCLRDAPLDDLYAADIQSPSFLTAFGPSVWNEMDKKNKNFILNIFLTG